MWIKICGIRDLETALMAAAAGADAIGLNFYEESPRVVAPAVAAKIIAKLRGDSARAVEPVGVFVNHSIDEIREICEECQLQTIQLHGDESPDHVARLVRDYRVMRAFRVGAQEIDAMSDHLEACDKLRAKPWACLVDGKTEGHFGGTGKTAPWETLRRLYRTSDWPPLVLAGGLTSENVADAIRVVNPWGVDVASGVESSIACKDATMVREFIQNARTSL